MATIYISVVSDRAHISVVVLDLRDLSPTEFEIIGRIVTGVGSSNVLETVESA